MGEKGKKWLLACYSTHGAIVLVSAVHATPDVVAAARAVRVRGRLGTLPTVGQEGRVFLLNSWLIRLIYLLSLYREVYLTHKQGLHHPYTRPKRV